MLRSSSPYPVNTEVQETFFLRIWNSFRSLFGFKKPKKVAKTPIPSPEQLREMVERLKEAIKKNPQDCSSHFKLGEALIHLKRIRDAIQPLTEATKIDPNFYEAFFHLGQAYAELGRDEDAIPPLEKAMDLKPDSEVVKKVLAGVYKEQCEYFGKSKRYDLAQEAFEKAIKIIPKFGPAFLSIGISLSQQGKYEEAFKKIELALKYDKNLTVDAYYQLGQIHEKLGDVKKAMKDYKNAILASPRAALPQLSLGLLYSKQDNFSDAAKHLQAAVTYNPRIASEGFFQLGRALLKLKRHDEAVVPFKEALKVTPDNKTVKDGLAESLFRVSEKLASENRIRDQIIILEEAVKANPHYGKCQFSLAKVYDEGKDGINAVIHMTLAREAFEKNKEKQPEALALKTLMSYFKKYDLNPRDYSAIRLPNTY
jgi:tetratricopeptide (TPR) repeat protein